MSDQAGWIGVDLDGTLAYYDGWRGYDHIGGPIPTMVGRVKEWLASGKKVKIFTARASTTDVDEHALSVYTIKKWCKDHIGVELEVTCTKDFSMIALWDDRCVRVEPNTGRVIS